MLQMPAIHRLSHNSKVHSLSSGIVAATPIHPYAARFQENSGPESPTKVETKRKLQKFTVSGWLIMNGGKSGSDKIENFRAKITFNMKSQYNY